MPVRPEILSCSRFSWFMLADCCLLPWCTVDFVLQDSLLSLARTDSYFGSSIFGKPSQRELHNIVDLILFITIKFPSSPPRSPSPSPPLYNFCAISALSAALDRRLTMSASCASTGLPTVPRCDWAKLLFSLRWLSLVGSVAALVKVRVGWASLAGRRGSRTKSPIPVAGDRLIFPLPGRGVLSCTLFLPGSLALLVHSGLSSWVVDVQLLRHLNFSAASFYLLPLLLSPGNFSLLVAKKLHQAA